MADHSRISKNERNQYCPRTKAELQELVNDESVSLGKIDTIHITDMSELFMAELDNDLRFHFVRSDFSGISSWNVSNVTDMKNMFRVAFSFNEDISCWDVSNVTDMSGMFAGARAFAADIGRWDVSKVTDMSDMFADARRFNGNIVRWDVSQVKNMSRMFYLARRFNRNIGRWNVSKVTDMSEMFCGARSFNGDIGGWDVGRVKSMASMFLSAYSFRRDISRWNAPNLINVHRMLWGTRAFQHDARLIHSSLKRAKGMILVAIEDVQTIAEAIAEKAFQARITPRQRRNRMRARAAALETRAEAHEERRIVDDFRDYMRTFLGYHLEEKNFYTMIRNRFCRRWIKALDVYETRKEWERGGCGLSYIDRFFRDNEYLDDSSGVTIARNAKDETRWNAYLECIAPRVLRNVEPNPWEDGYTGRFWPWREKLAWFHRQKQGMKVRCIGTKGQTRKKLYMVTLNDRCGPGGCDWPLRLFVDSIEEFQRRWFRLEENFWRRWHRPEAFEEFKEKFLRSKAGEIVCDYYNKPEYNIVQSGDTVIIAEKSLLLEDVWFTYRSFDHLEHHYHVDWWTVRFRWFSFQGKYLRTASYHATGACGFYLYPRWVWTVRERFGNNILEIAAPFSFDGEYRTAEENAGVSLRDFAENTVVSIADMVSCGFDNESDLLADAASFVPTEKNLGELFRDIAGT